MVDARQLVLIEVSGGIAEVITKPPGVDVLIIDYDLSDVLTASECDEEINNFVSQIHDLVPYEDDPEVVLTIETLNDKIDDLITQREEGDYD